MYKKSFRFIAMCKINRSWHIYNGTN